MVTQKVVATPPKSSIFLTLTIRPGSESSVLGLLPAVSGLTRSVGFRHPDAELLNVVGIGSEAWDRLLPNAHRPQHLHPFRELTGHPHHAPSTPGDLLFHIRGRTPDMCFELARVLMEKFGPYTSVEDEVHAFKYFDERDLLGFVDGTENPENDEAYDAVLIDDDPKFDGGSYVHVQKYVHDLAAWDSITVEEQERVIGRTKSDDLEFPDDEKPSNSHLALNDVSDDEGNDLDILRYNMAFGDFSSGDMGTYFIGYAKDPGVTEQMLENMFLGDPPGNYDRILDFSTAQTGALFFVPSIDLLDEIDALAEGSPAPTNEPAPSTPLPTDTESGDRPHEGFTVGRLQA
ncbi:Dyp-type peroxidase [uncultured Kocuria sp.]|uniref:Dyp-type peroxidase n=1 Tax=uncultured Kocuria sp. TaxID=259305 RepID=UPI0025941129|nr:Dyp-type peroxidase [uncultured Kocuria sp.]MCT1367833.1 Dyp-type peroxidase [Rothia sp. p3-SID1597]